MPPTYAELHSHTNFSFLHGASPVEDMAERAAELGLSGLAVTDHDGLYGVVRFTTAAQAAGIRPVSGSRSSSWIRRRPIRTGSWSRPGAGRGLEPRGPRAPDRPPAATAIEGLPARPRPDARPAAGPSTRRSRRTCAGSASGSAGRTSCCSHATRRAIAACAGSSPARISTGPSACRGSPRRCSPSNVEGLLALSGGREGEIARRLRVGDRAGARAVAERYAKLFGRADGAATAGLLHRAVPPPAARRRLARRGARRPRRRARPAGRRHERRPLRPARGSRAARRPDRRSSTAGRSTRSADLRRPDGESYLKSAAELARPAARLGRGVRASASPGAWAEGIATAGEIAAACSVDLGFEQYRFPGFPVPKGETAFSYLSELCWAGARRRYHPLTSAVVNRLAHELDVIERAGLAEFFLICWDLMRFAKEQGIPAQGRGSATSSIVSYTLGISRVEPIAAQPPVRAVHQRGPDDLPGRRHRLQLGAARGGHPVHLQPLRPRAHRDGLQPRHVPGAVGGPGGRLRAGVPAAARRPRGEGARDVRQRHGPARPRGRRRLRRVLPAPGRGAAGRRGRLPPMPPRRAASSTGWASSTQRMPLVGKVPPWRQPPKPDRPDRAAAVRLARGGAARRRRRRDHLGDTHQMARSTPRVGSQRNRRRRRLNPVVRPPKPSRHKRGTGRTSMPDTRSARPLTRSSSPPKPTSGVDLAKRSRG